MAKYVVARADEIAPGGRLIVDVRGRSVGIFNIDGDYFALRNSCPHEGGPVCLGDIVGTLNSPGPREYEYDASAKYVQCPWHNWEYEIRTGQSWFDPVGNATRRYDVEVADGVSLQETLAEPSAPGGRRKGPFVAETYQVLVEHEYLVLNM